MDWSSTYFGGSSTYFGMSKSQVEQNISVDKIQLAKVYFVIKRCQ